MDRRALVLGPRKEKDLEVWANLRKSLMGLYPHINISQPFHKPYINNRRTQNSASSFFADSTPFFIVFEHNSENGYGEEDGTSRSLSLSENLQLLF